MRPFLLFRCRWHVVLIPAVLISMLPGLANSESKDSVDPDKVAQICNAAMNLCVDACDKKYQYRIASEGHISAGNTLSHGLCTDRCVELNQKCNGDAALRAGKKSGRSKQLRVQ